MHTQKRLKCAISQCSFTFPCDLFLWLLLQWVIYCFCSSLFPERIQSTSLGLSFFPLNSHVFLVLLLSRVKLLKLFFPPWQGSCGKSFISSPQCLLELLKELNSASWSGSYDPLQLLPSFLLSMVPITLTQHFINIKPYRKRCCFSIVPHLAQIQCWTKEQGIGSLDTIQWDNRQKAESLERERCDNCNKDAALETMSPTVIPWALECVCVSGPLLWALRELSHWSSQPY